MNLRAIYESRTICIMKRGKIYFMSDWKCENKHYKAINKKDRYRKRKSKITNRLIIYLACFAVCITVLVAWTTKAEQKEDSPEAVNIETLREQATEAATEKNRADGYKSEITVLNPERPVRRSRQEAIDYLSGFIKNDENINRVIKKKYLYPDDMLIALSNNREMSGFAAGYLNHKESNIRAKLTDEEKSEEYPLLLQWDERWGYKQYGNDSIIGLSGCGPVCLSMMMISLLGDEDLTPDVVAEYGMKAGYYVEGSGTAWSFMTDYPQMYNINAYKTGTSEEEIKEILDGHGIVICAMAEGDFTLTGHFIMVYGYNEEGFLINDPNSIARSNRIWTYDEIGWQIKGTWGYTYTLY